MPQTFVIKEKEKLIADDWSTERTAEIVSHQMISGIHFSEGASVEYVIAQKLITGAVKLVCTGSRDDIDLAAACTPHLSVIASCLNFEFLYSVGRGAEVE